MHLKFIQYVKGSKGLTNLIDAIKAKKIPGLRVSRQLGSEMTFDHRAIPINWGCSNINPGSVLLNSGAAIQSATHKTICLMLLDLANVSTLDWTYQKKYAEEWLQKGKTVVGRSYTKGHSGIGIVLLNQGDAVPDLPLYTLYKPKKKEFRVHVFRGQVIDVQEKRKRTGVEANPKIRNHDNGWVFCRDAITEPADLRTTAIAAAAALDLDFGGIDIIWNEKENKCYVLELNTAPGIEGTTASLYADAFINYANTL